MKKRFLLFVILFPLTIITSTACEICGCGHSNFQIGLLPTFNKGFIGFRYNFSQFNSHVKDEPSEFSHDYFQTAELWGGYSYKKLQVMAFAPYVISRKESDDRVTTSNGIGDFMILLNYKVLESASAVQNDQTTIKHELYFGGGVKLPTGKNRVNPTSPEFNMGDFNSQAGTGSMDYIINTTYNFRWNNSGIVTNAAYRLNTANNQDYKFGNRVYVNTAYYYTFTKNEVKIKPNAGVNYQSNVANTFQKAEVENSHGYNLSSTIGVNVLRNKIGFNAMSFIPLAQNSYDHQTKLKSRFLIGVTFSI
jgi:hypothetical protein